MRKTYRTVEEVRKQARERQARWRERNRGYERQRAKNNYAKRGARGSGIGEGMEPADSRARGTEEGADIGAGVAISVGAPDVCTRERDGGAGLGGEQGDPGDNESVLSSETHYEDLEGVDKPYREYEERNKRFLKRKSPRPTAPGSDLRDDAGEGGLRPSLAGQNPKEALDAPACIRATLSLEEQKVEAWLSEVRAKQNNAKGLSIRLEID